MPDQQQPAIGSIAWRDLTVPNADQIREFYSQVVGWKTTAHNMGAYDDYCVIEPSTGQAVAGICNARGENANIPPQWLIYITVSDVEASARRCVAHGGKIVDGPRLMGQQSFCVIQDPAGAAAALISQPQATESEDAS